MASSTDIRERAATASARTNSRPPAPVDRPSLAVMIERLKPEIARALPKHVSVDRITRIAITALRRNMQLNACTPESFLGALLTASQLGLEVNTPAGEAYLIPYRDECTLVIGYQGIVKLFWQHPQAKHIDAQAVYERDEFDYAYGLNPFLSHKPARGDRGQVIYYYAVATLTGGGSAFAVLTPEDVRALRKASGPNGGIPDPMHWMERKTAIKQMLKLLPKTVELTAAVTADEQVRTDYSRSLEDMEVHAPAIEAPASAPAAEEPAAEEPAETVDVDAAAAQDGPVVEDPPEDPWAGVPVAEPGSGARRRSS